MLVIGFVGVPTNDGMWDNFIQFIEPKCEELFGVATIYLLETSDVIELKVNKPAIITRLRLWAYALFHHSRRLYHA